MPERAHDRRVRTGLSLAFVVLAITGAVAYGRATRVAEGAEAVRRSQEAVAALGGPWSALHDAGPARDDTNAAADRALRAVRELADAHPDRDERLALLASELERRRLLLWETSLGQATDQITTARAAVVDTVRELEAEASRLLSERTRRAAADGRALVGIVRLGTGLALMLAPIVILILRPDLSRRRRGGHDAIREAKPVAAVRHGGRDVLLAGIEGELQPPVSDIIAVAGLALDVQDLPEAARTRLEMVRASAEALREVIGEIRDYAQIEAGSFDLEHIPFDLRACLGETAKALAPSADEKGLELALRIPADVPETIVGDPGRLRQVIQNLVENAVKFTARGEIVLRVAALPGDDGTELAFAVADTGIGVPVESREAIFDPLAHADTSRANRYDGAGLGLATAARLVERMGGRIWVESNGDQGSVFHFTARFALPDAPAQHPASADIGALRDVPVLVVDDNPTSRHVLEGMLEDWHMTPTAVDGGDAALTALRAARAAGSPFPLVVVDARMPGMDGFAVAEHITGSPPLADATIMLLPPDSDPVAAARCRALGLSSHLTKPIVASELLEAITEALA